MTEQDVKTVRSGGQDLSRADLSPIPDMAQLLQPFAAAAWSSGYLNKNFADIKVLVENLGDRLQELLSFGLAEQVGQSAKLTKKGISELSALPGIMDQLPQG